MFLTGFLLWSMDNVYCRELMKARNHVLLPWAVMLEGHGWWHILTGLGGMFHTMLRSDLKVPIPVCCTANSNTPCDSLYIHRVVHLAPSMSGREREGIHAGVVVTAQVSPPGRNKNGTAGNRRRKRASRQKGMLKMKRQAEKRNACSFYSKQGVR